MKIKRQAERQEDRLTDRQRDRETGRQSDRLTDRQRWTEEQMQRERERDRQTQTHRQTDRRTDGQADPFQIKQLKNKLNNLKGWDLATSLLNETNVKKIKKNTKTHLPPESHGTHIHTNTIFTWRFENDVSVSVNNQKVSTALSNAKTKPNQWAYV